MGEVLLLRLVNVVVIWHSDGESKYLERKAIGGSDGSKRRESNKKISKKNL